MMRLVAVIRTGVSEVLIASIMRATGIDELGTALARRFFCLRRNPRYVCL
jgi:hypothetical protein